MSERRTHIVSLLVHAFEPAHELGRLRSLLSYVTHVSVESDERLERCGFVPCFAQLDKRIFAHRLVEPVACPGGWTQSSHERLLDEAGQQLEHGSAVNTGLSCHGFDGIESDVRRKHREPAQECSL